MELLEVDLKEDIFNLRKINRIKAHRIPKMGKHWCRGCDRSYLNDGQKCKICGNRNRKRDKK
jgi:rRNA maturation endonuclease Nob1